MPAKLDRCVNDLKNKGGVDNPWAVCNSSLNHKTKENVNHNRQDPYPSPDIKVGKIQVPIQKTPKGIGGENLDKNKKRKKQESILYKQILDTKLGYSNDPTKRQ